MLQPVYVFDMDYTLYPAATGVLEVNHHTMSVRFAELAGLALADSMAKRDQLWSDPRGFNTAIEQDYGWPPNLFYCFMDQLAIDHLRPDPRLNKVLAELTAPKIIFTNADYAFAHRVMRQLQMAHLFDHIHCATTADYVTKPSPHAYDAFTQRYGLDDNNIVFFEDTPDNLAPAQARGWTTVLVTHGRAIASPHADYTVNEVVDYFEKERL